MIQSLIFALLFMLSLSVTSLSASDIMPLSEVKEGMIGVGRTVFKGDQIEEFQVEILGVLQNYLPQQNLILGILKGSNLEQTGVIAGMSGSPVFINGKMIGAVAYSWPFAKTPIAGITPIESMLEAQSINVDQVPIAPPIEIAEYYNFEKVLASQLGGLPKVDAALPSFGRFELTPIAAPLTVAGFHPKLLDRFQPIFSSFGWQVMQGGAATIGKSTTPQKASNLEPGSPVSVQLIRGDFDIGAIGTVTYRDADKILAFGHPFFNLGPIDFPMATAKIYAVVPSLFSSFKVGSAGAVVGSAQQDLHSAVFGIMGKKSPMIPVTVNFGSGGKSKRTFRFEVANHKILSPLLVDFAFQNSILTTQIGYSESTLKISGLISVKGNSPIQISNIFSGAGSFANASQYVASILYFLMTNEFKNPQVQDIVLNVDTTMSRKEAELVEVWLDRNEVHPGDEVKLKAVYRPLLGEKQVKEFTLRIPDDLNLPHVNFIVGGGQEISRQELAQYGRAYEPDSFDQIVWILNSLRSNDRIYVKAFQSEQSLVMKGQALHYLPSSVYSVLSSSQTIGAAQKVNTLALWEDSEPVDFFLTGTKVFALKILPKQH